MPMERLEPWQKIDTQEKLQRIADIEVKDGEKVK